MISQHDKKAWHALITTNKSILEWVHWDHTHISAQSDSHYMRKKKNIATLLLLDMSEAFFKILQKQLIHIIKRKKTNDWLIKFYFSYLIKKSYWFLTIKNSKFLTF